MFFPVYCFLTLNYVLMSQSFSIFAPIINQTKRIMKKVLLMLVACAAMTACQQKGKTAEAMDNVDSTETMDSLRFQGEVPAADGPGIRYEVALANDTTNGFSMTRTYLEAENGRLKASPARPRKSRKKWMAPRRLHTSLCLVITMPNTSSL